MANPKQLRKITPHTDKLILYHDCEDGGGDSVIDRSPNHHHADLVGTPVFFRNRFGKGFWQTDAVGGDYLRNPDFVLPVNSTFIIFMSVDEDGNAVAIDGLFGVRDTTNDASCALIEDSGAVDNRFSAGGSDVPPVTKKYSYTKPFMCSVRLTPTSVRASFNEDLQFILFDSLTFVGTAQDFYFGARNNFNLSTVETGTCKIFQVCAWDKLLSDSQIISHFQRFHRKMGVDVFNP